MKRTLISMLVLYALLVIACSKESPAEVKTGSLIIINRSSEIAYVKVDSGILNQIPANGSKTFVIDTGKAAGNRSSASPVIHYYGSYLQEKTDTVSVASGTTYNYNLDANCGQLKINNNCDLPISIFFSGDSLYAIDSNSYAEYKIKPADGLSTRLTYTYKGLYVLPNSRSTTVYTDVTATTNINPNAGALIITNESNSLVQHLYLKSTAASDWGEDLLTDYFYPGNSITLTVEAGDYNIKLIDLNESVHYINDEVITVNQSSTVTYDGL